MINRELADTEVANVIPGVLDDNANYLAAAFRFVNVHNRTSAPPPQSPSELCTSLA
jgi:hypothetical protein